MHGKFIHECLSLAELGRSEVAPNPMVGCVLVENETIISTGYHTKYGAAHAEREAILAPGIQDKLHLCTLYVNLEPCSHQGKTPPCADLIIDSGIKRVVIGAKDPNPLVAGKGIKKLKDAGIEVIEGIEEAACRALNCRFYTFYEQKRPYIILKWARSCDNFMAPVSQKQGEIFWITGQESQTLNHLWRSREMAILVGEKTIKMDDPSLTVRLVAGKNPLRIILDPDSRIIGNYKILTDPHPTIIVTRRESKIEGNKEWIQLPFSNLHKELNEWLYHRNISSIIIEGGVQTIQDYILTDNWDEARIFTGPVHMGAGLPGPLLRAKPTSVQFTGSDILHTFFRTLPS